MTNHRNCSPLGIAWLKVPRHWVLLVVLVQLLLSACAGIKSSDRPELRARLNADAENTLTEFIAKDPDLQSKIKGAPGYLIGMVNMEVVAAIGGSDAVGIVFDKDNQTRTYVDIRSYELGLGMGSTEFKLLLVPESRESLDRLKSGFWRSSVTTSSFAGSAAGYRTSTHKDVSLHVLTESGAALGATAGLVRVSVNEKLTETAFSEVGIPVRGLHDEERETTESPKVWTRRLPFLAQEVIDQGFNLPLPYGAGVTYASVESLIGLTGLEVGFFDQPQEPYEFVGFENSSIDTQTYQIKLDTWVFPFMNVFALLGKVDGRVRMDVLVDGNGMLDQIGTNCDRVIKPPLCLVLQDKDFVLPVDAPISSESYSLGMLLAGGFGNWFATIPVSASYAKPADAVTEGFSWTITPRAGYIVKLPDLGNLALYAGGNYLKAKMTVEGVFRSPEDNLVINYTAEQENRGRWNLVLGANWDISRSLSLQFEYNGFIGSRNAVLGSFVYRY